MNADDIFKAGRALGATANSLRAASAFAALAAGAKNAADATEASGGDATFARAAERTFADLAVAHAGAALEEVAGAASAVSPAVGFVVECARRVALDGYRDAVEAKRNADGPRKDVPAAGAAERAGGIVVNVAAGDADEQGLHAEDGSTPPRCACGEPAAFTLAESKDGGGSWRVTGHQCAACSARELGPAVPPVRVAAPKVEA